MKLLEMSIMSSYSAHRPSIKTSHPRGYFPDQLRQREVIKSCSHCRNDFGLKKWDCWNGFLVVCPHCDGLQGRSWNIKSVLLASFFFHAVSFFFTLRLPKAIFAVLGFILVGFGGNYVLDHYQIPDLLAVIGAALFILAPMLINALILVLHERALDAVANHRATLSSSVYNPGGGRAAA
jgi:hypothetical protein